MRILLADDHKIVRDGLRALLEEQPETEVAAKANDGRATVRLARELSPEVVIMDISMPDLNGIEATRQIKAESPRVKVIALSMHSDRRFVTEVLKAGTSGYLLKDCAFEELATAIRAVVENKTYLSPQIADLIREDYRQTKQKMGGSAFSDLTEREREVLQLLAEGQSVKEIASSLGVSMKTVETYRQHLMDKLNVHSLADLVKYAIRQGLTSLEP